MCSAVRHGLSLIRSIARHHIIWFFIFSDGHVLDDCPIDEQTKQILLENIRRYLTPSEVKCRASK